MYNILTHSLAGHDQVILSEQMLVDDCGTGSCDGGLESSGLTTIINLGGIASEDDYPYTTEDGNITQGFLN